MREEIEPDAAMHQSPTKATMNLKKVVANVKAIILQLPSPAPEIQEDFELADELVTRIVEKKKKPALNTSDLDYY